MSIESLYAQEDGADEEEDKMHLRRVAHVLIDKGEHQMAIDLLGRVKVMEARRRSREDVRA